MANEVVKDAMKRAGEKVPANFACASTEDVVAIATRLRKALQTVQQELVNLAELDPSIERIVQKTDKPVRAVYDAVAAAVGASKSLK